jgi:hypothetical protein
VRVFNTARGKEWLEKELVIKKPVKTAQLPDVDPVTTPQQKSRKPFNAMSARGKRYRILSLFTRTPELDELTFLHENSKKPKRLDLSSPIDKRKKDNDTLLLYYDVNQGKARYQEAASRHNWPSYYHVQKAKKNVLYPKNICYGESRVEVSLSDLMAQSCARILEYLYEENSSLMTGLTATEKISLGLWAKVGGDGQGDHSVYSQKNKDNVNGSCIYCISFVPLQLKANSKLLWVNKEPNSPLICMPLLFTFAKETDEFIQCEEKKLRKQIENLSDIFFSVGREDFCLKADTVKVYNTMWDGKSCTSIAKTYLGGCKKLSTNTCHLCLATPSDMNKPDVWERPIILPQMMEYSCTVLHMWIRSMEFLFNMSVKTQLFNMAVAKAKLPGLMQNKKKKQEDEVYVPALTSPDGELIKMEMKV